MATLLYTFTDFAPKVVTLTAADTAYSVVLPQGSHSFTLRPRTNDARYQTEDVAMGAADDWVTVAADSTSNGDVSTKVHGNPATIYLATGSAGTEVEILPSPSGV